MRNYIPSPDYLNRAKKLLFSKEFGLIAAKDNYYLANERINDSRLFNQLLCSNGITERYKISPGTSERFAFPLYLKQIFEDLKNHVYRTYTVPQGSFDARKALAFYESINLGGNSFDPDDICLSIGSTGAITLVLECIKKMFPKKNVIIPVPTYYLYTLTAKFLNLPFKEVLCYRRTNKNIASFIDVDEIIRNTDDNTSLVVLVNPSNPSGEIYSDDSLKKVIVDAQKKDYLILVDELFSDLSFQKFTPASKIASEMNALDRLVIVKGYSKNKNLAGLRLGYVFSKNQRMMRYIQKISEVRNCFPYGEQYTGLIVIDAFIQSLYDLTKKGFLLSKAINLIKKELSFSSYISEKNSSDLEKYYIAYANYFNRQMKFYKSEFERVKRLLRHEIELETPTSAAFNTFLKINGLENINYFDFCFNLLITTGVYTQVGPAFGLGQKEWEESNKLGFWLRITFARDTKMMTEGIKRFTDFKKVYLNNPDKFIKTGLHF